MAKENDTLAEIRSEIRELKRLVKASGKRMMTADEVAEYLGVTKVWVYELVSKRALPTYKPNGRRVYFDREEVDEYLKRGGVAGRPQADAAAVLSDYASGR